MTAPAEDDGALDGHLERQARAPNQANPVYSAQVTRRHARLGKTATAALCAQVGGYSLGRANLFRVTRDLIWGQALPGSRRREERIPDDVN